MKALLLAAGLGTRLRPLTDNVPKCLVQIKGKPLLELWLDQLSLNGINSFLINTHYLHKQVENFIKSSKYEDEVNIVYEPFLLGTAGTLISNFDFFKESECILIHADNYCLADFSEFIKAHYDRPNGCLMTMMTFRTDSPSDCGILNVNKKGIVVDYYEKIKDPPGNLANGAIYILSVEFLKIIKENFNEAKDFSNDILGNFLGKIYTYESKEILIDIGSIKNYDKANSL